jgi:hypothetical protein
MKTETNKNMPIKSGTSKNMAVKSWIGKDLQISLMAEAETLI